MTLCLQSFGFVSFKGNVDLDLPIYLIKGISFENLTMKLWKQSNYRKGNILVTVLWSCIGSASGWNYVGGGAPVMEGNVELLRAAKVLQDGRGGVWLWGGWSGIKVWAQQSCAWAQASQCGFSEGFYGERAQRGACWVR